MPYWLMKSEPDEFSIHDLKNWATAAGMACATIRRVTSCARCRRDHFFFYHSSCAEPGIAGVGRVIRSAYPDPTALDPESPYHDGKASSEANPGVPWTSSLSKPSRLLALARLKANPALRELALVKRQPPLGHAGKRYRVASDPGDALSYWMIRLLNSRSSTRGLPSSCSSTSRTCFNAS